MRGDDEICHTCQVQAEELRQEEFKYAVVGIAAQWYYNFKHPFDWRIGFAFPGDITLWPVIKTNTIECKGLEGARSMSHESIDCGKDEWFLIFICAAGIFSAVNGQ